RIKSGIRRAGALRSQGSILRSATDAMSLPAIRWEVGAPAPTIKISVWFEYSMIPDQNPEFAELGLCGPREASYAPLRMLCHYRQFAGKLKLQLRRWEVGAPAPIKKNGVVSG